LYSTYQFNRAPKRFSRQFVTLSECRDYPAWAEVIRQVAAAAMRPVAVSSAAAGWRACMTGVRVHGSVLLPAERPPDADQARHRTDNVARQLSAQGRARLLRADAPRPHLDPVRRRPGNGHVQVQVRRHGRRRVRLSVNRAGVLMHRRVSAYRLLSAFSTWEINDVLKTSGLPYAAATTNSNTHPTNRNPKP